QESMLRQQQQLAQIQRTRQHGLTTTPQPISVGPNNPFVGPSAVSASASASAAAAAAAAAATSSHDMAPPAGSPLGPAPPSYSPGMATKPESGTGGFLQVSELATAPGGCEKYSGTAPNAAAASRMQLRPDREGATGAFMDAAVAAAAAAGPGATAAAGSAAADSYLTSGWITQGEQVPGSAETPVVGAVTSAAGCSTGGGSGGGESSNGCGSFEGSHSRQQQQQQVQQQEQQQEQSDLAAAQEALISELSFTPYSASEAVSWLFAGDDNGNDMEQLM
ncbi:hypothetical protein Vretifemale_667, partial [Volvox reticuliferus]